MFRRGYRPFKLIKGENATNTFLPLNMKIGGPVKYAKNKDAICLTKDQARHIFMKVESEGTVNVDTIEQEIEEDKLSKDNTDEEVNPYQNIIKNSVHKDSTNTSQMEQWFVLSSIGNYVQYDRIPENYELNVKALDQRNHRKRYDILKDDERQTLEIDFGNYPNKLRREYLVMYEGVQYEMLNTTRFDESLGLTATYLGRTYMTRAAKIKAEEKSAILEQGYTVAYNC